MHIRLIVSLALAAAISLACLPAYYHLPGFLSARVPIITITMIMMIIIITLVITIINRIIVITGFQSED